MIGNILKKISQNQVFKKSEINKLGTHVHTGLINIYCTTKWKKVECFSHNILVCIFKVKYTRSRLAKGHLLISVQI